MLAAATSSPALAEDGVAGIAIPSVSELEAATTALLGDAGLVQPALVVSDPPIALPAVPAQTTAAEPATEGAGAAAPPPEPAPDAPVEAVLPDVGLPTATAAPTVRQTAPANVNVSVRVDSPGDNGAVAQVNVAAAIGALPSVPQYQPEPPQYQPPIAAAAAPAAAPVTEQTTEPLADSPVTAASGWNWTWTWDCGDPIPEIPVAPDIATQNWIWNWNWNCEDDQAIEGNSDAESASQYQPVITQYRPININVSIRINSPGSDGPVLQANVAVAVAAPVVPTPIAPLPGALPPPAGNATQSEPATDVAPAQALVPALLWFDGGLEIGPIQDDLVGCCLAAAPGGAPGATGATRNVLDAPQSAAVAGDITAPARFRASVAVTLRLARAAEHKAQAERASRKPARTVRPAPPRRHGGPAREPAVVVNAAGMAPLSAPDGRLGYLVLLVVGIAFAIAFADASRSVAAEVRAAGEDPDPPPDHPG